MRRTLTHALVRLLSSLIFALVAFAATAVAQKLPAGESRVPADPFTRHAWHLELTGHGALETWNYNGNHEEMAGLFAGVTYAVREGLELKIGSPLYHVWQRGTDAYLFGLTWGVRGRLAKKRRWSGFWEFEVGVSESDTYVPPRGTRFNYLAIGSGGVAWRIRPGVHAMGGVRWVHISNNSLAGRDRNPDVEAVGPMLGLLYGF